MGRTTNDNGCKGWKGGKASYAEWLFRFVDDPLPLFEVDVPPRSHRVPVEKALPLKQRTEGENLGPPPLQLVGHQVIRHEGNNNRFPPVAGQLEIRMKHPRSRPLRKILQSTTHSSGVVEDVVAVDVGGGAFETFGDAPVEELVFVD